VIGAYDLPTAQLIAAALAGMDIERAFVIHGAGGWDEPTPIGPFDLLEVRGGTVRSGRRDPGDYGLARCAPDDLAGGDAVHNAGLLRRVLVERERGPRRDALPGMPLRRQERPALRGRRSGRRRGCRLRPGTRRPRAA
jgi:anthranilate phosphoribosyltransferase